MRFLSPVALGPWHQGAPSWSWPAGAWPGARPGAPQFLSLRDVVWNHLPLCPEVRDSGGPVAGTTPPSLSFVCAGWQKSAGSLAGSCPSLLPDSFSVESLRAGGGGPGAPSEAGLSHPSAFSTALVLSQNSSVCVWGGVSSKPSWGSADRVLA